MSSADRDPMARHDHADDIAAYVLGALDGHELEQFTRHLDGCIVCRDDVASFQNVVAALPLAAPQVRPPSRLRRRIMRQLAAEARATQVTARRPSRLRPALAVGFALAAVGGAVAAGDLGRTVGSPRIIHAQTIGQPAGATAYLRLAAGQAELVVRHMPGPPLDQVYEVWLVRGRHAPEPTSALFNVTSRGAGAVVVPGDLRGVTRVLVTREPIGGSEVPTHAPVIAAALS